MPWGSDVNFSRVGLFSPGYILPAVKYTEGCLVVATDVTATGATLSDRYGEIPHVCFHAMPVFRSFLNLRSTLQWKLLTSKYTYSPSHRL